jgi:hypothetical protein
VTRPVTDERVENAISREAIRTTTLNAKTNAARIGDLFESVFTEARQIEIMAAALFDDANFEDWRGYLGREDDAAERSHRSEA